MTTLLAIDGNALVHRCFHAGNDLPDPETFVGRCIWRIAEAVGMGADAIVVAFDHADNIRAQEFPTYKAGRPSKPALFSDCMLAAVRDMATCGLYVLPTPDGLEADDALDSIAKHATAQLKINVLSPDRDLLALVTEHVTVLRPASNGLVAIDPAAVKKQYGIEPASYHQFAALRGDPSDGLPGVKGIGRRTAATLIRRYKTVDALYESLQYQTPKVEAALRRDKDLLQRNLDLMAPREVPVDLDAMLAAVPNPDRVDALLEERGVAGAAGYFRRCVESPPRDAFLVNSFSEDDEPLIDLAETRLPSSRPELVDATPAGTQDGLF